MTKGVGLLTAVAALLLAGAAAAQYPVADMIAEKLIQKYQQSTCEQLWQERSQLKPALAHDVVQALRNDPPMRTHFINKVAAPIANKMFECGMIP
jgi:hypothetical protein